MRQTHRNTKYVHNFGFDKQNCKTELDLIKTDIIIMSC